MTEDPAADGSTESEVKRPHVHRHLRSLVAQIVARRKALLEAWNELDLKEERELKDGHSDYNKIKQAYAVKHPHTLKSLTTHLGSSRPVQDRLRHLELVIQQRLDKGARCESMKGYRVATDLPPLSPDGRIGEVYVQAMVAAFKKGEILPYADTFQILRQTYRVLLAFENVVDISMEPTQQTTIVGDIHGQLEDLLTIFNLNGYPSEENLYIFNGDFVDRGQNSCECVLLLFALLLACPEFVYLNRGNHEAKDMNSMDGFERECLDKYDMNLYALFSEVFACLPLACVVQKKVFVVHGGLSWRDFTIQNLLEVNRFHVIPPPQSLLQDILWSDPSGAKGRRSSRRGAGVEFGQDVCLSFLRKHKLMLMVRSHECVNQGFEGWFGNKCLTVFSASNYCGDTGNLGAYMVLSSELKLKIQQYEAISTIRSTTQQLDQLSKRVVSKLIRRIALHAWDLHKYWTKVEVSPGRITRIQWVAGLSHVLDLGHVAFLHFQEPLGLTPTKVGDCINYHEFLEKYRPQHAELDRILGPLSLEGVSNQENLRACVAHLLFSQQCKLESLFRHFDQDKHGSITISEFVDGIHALTEIMGRNFSRSEIHALLRSIDKDGSQTIEYREFFQAFGPADAGISARLLAGGRKRGTVSNPVSRHNSYCSQKKEGKEKEEEEDDNKDEEEEEEEGKEVEGKEEEEKEKKNAADASLSDGPSPTAAPRRKRLRRKSYHLPTPCSVGSEDTSDSNTELGTPNPTNTLSSKGRQRRQHSIFTEWRGAEFSHPAAIQHPKHTQKATAAAAAAAAKAVALGLADSEGATRIHSPSASGSALNLSRYDSAYRHPAALKRARLANIPDVEPSPTGESHSPRGIPPSLLRGASEEGPGTAWLRIEPKRNKTTYDDDDASEPDSPERAPKTRRDCVTPRCRWVADEERDRCFRCNVRFSPINRKHHCRWCGEVICQQCSYIDNKGVRFCLEQCWDQSNGRARLTGPSARDSFRTESFKTDPSPQKDASQPGGQPGAASSDAAAGDKARRWSNDSQPKQASRLSQQQGKQQLGLGQTNNQDEWCAVM